MAAMTGDQIMDRVRSICATAPFEFPEAPSWESFDLVPSQLGETAFRVLPPASQRVVGGFNFSEDRTDSLQIWVLRKINGDWNTTRQQLVRAVHSLTAAIVRDGHQVSGDYGVPDEGRGHAVQAPPGRDYATVRLTLPINYDVQL